MRVEPFIFILSPQEEETTHEKEITGELLADEPFAFVLFAPLPLPL